MPSQRTTNPDTEHDPFLYEMELAATDLGPAIEPQVLPPTVPAIGGEPVDYKGHRVLTTEQAARAFEVDPGRIANNFDRNRPRFEEGQHFHLIVGDELRALKNQTSSRGLVAPQASHLILWTERGIARHAKMLESDTAWAIFEALECSYFAVKEVAVARAPALPNFADPASAARAWAEQWERRVLAERKKAEIGSRREATAMNTARWAKDRAKKLEIELDRSNSYATVKRMEIAFGRKFSWHPLKKASVAMGLEIKTIDDPNFNTVNSYHARAWREAYNVDVPGWTGEEDA